MKIDRSDDYRGGYALGYEAGKKRAGDDIQNADRRAAEEHERFVALLLDTAQRWAIYAAANQEHPEKVAAGEAVDQVCRELAKEVKAWTVRPEPTPAEPSAELESE